MAWHLAAYSGLVGTTANTAVAPVPDQILTIQNSRFFPGRTTNLFAAYAASTTITRARLVSATLRQIANPQIRPITRAVGGITDPNVMDLRNIPLSIPGLEELGMEATTGLAMGSEQVTGLIWMGDGLVPAPSGEVITVRLTGTTAAVANTWSDMTMTLDDSLGQGEYTIVGGDWFSTTAIAWRLILDGQMERPGGLGVAAIDRRGPLLNYAGYMGSWGRFRTTALPRFQLLAGAADATHELYLQVVRNFKLSPGPI